LLGSLAYAFEEAGDACGGFFDAVDRVAHNIGSCLEWFGGGVAGGLEEDTGFADAVEFADGVEFADAGFEHFDSEAAEAAVFGFEVIEARVSIGGSVLGDAPAGAREKP
jgi:hypothetical protein